MSRSFGNFAKGKLQGMVPFLAVIAVLAAMALVYFAFETFRLGRIAEELEGENADLRGRLSNLVGEVRRLREASGLPFETGTQSAQDELMPIRRASRTAGAAPLTGRNRAVRPAENPDLVAIVSADLSETKRIGDALTANGYRTVTSSLADAPRYAHELSTAAVIFDLRDPGIATGAQVMLTAFANDPLAKEVPIFALVGNKPEQEKLVDEGTFAAAFLAPTDTALLTSNLGAALIRRRTRTQRAAAARNLSAALSRP